MKEHAVLQKQSKSNKQGFIPPVGELSYSNLKLSVFLQAQLKTVQANTQP
ncbi:MAG: hypothetical protein HC880_00885 [Bacteroidia bacterium]|nr:hypothetical protein [Bacteroidia bacterium]